MKNDINPLMPAAANKQPGNFLNIFRQKHTCEKIWRGNVKQNTMNNSKLSYIYVCKVILDSKVIVKIIRYADDNFKT